MYQYGFGGSAGQLCEVEVVDAKHGRQSACEPFRAVVERVNAGLSAQCVYQDLVHCTIENGYSFDCIDW